MQSNINTSLSNISNDDNNNTNNRNTNNNSSFYHNSANNDQYSQANYLNSNVNQNINDQYHTIRSNNTQGIQFHNNVATGNWLPQPIPGVDNHFVDQRVPLLSTDVVIVTDNNNNNNNNNNQNNFSNINNMYYTYGSNQNQIGQSQYQYQQQREQQYPMQQQSQLYYAQYTQQPVQRLVPQQQMSFTNQNVVLQNQQLSPQNQQGSPQNQQGVIQNQQIVLHNQHKNIITTTIPHVQQQFLIYSDASSKPYENNTYIFNTTNQPKTTYPNNKKISLPSLNMVLDHPATKEYINTHTNDTNNLLKIEKQNNIQHFNTNNVNYQPNIMDNFQHNTTDQVNTKNTYSQPEENQLHALSTKAKKSINNAYRTNAYIKTRQGRPITMDVSVNLIYYESLDDYIITLLQKNPINVQNPVQQHQVNTSSSSFSLGANNLNTPLIINSNTIVYNQRKKTKKSANKKTVYYNLSASDSKNKKNTGKNKIKYIRKPLLLSITDLNEPVVPHIKKILGLSETDEICIIKHHKNFNEKDNFETDHKNEQDSTPNENYTNFKFDYITLSDQNSINVGFFKKVLCYPKYRTNLKLIFVKKTKEFSKFLRIYLNTTPPLRSKEESDQPNDHPFSLEQQVPETKIKECDDDSYGFEAFSKDNNNKVFTALCACMPNKELVIKVWSINKC